MRGEGWACDNCDELVVQDKHFGYPNIGDELPDGWCAFIYRDKNEQSHQMQIRHLCSPKCLEEYAYVLKKQESNE